jgi:FlaG/FlaF family flagellin (archaellin)
MIKKQKKALSPVISAVFLVALSIAAIAILWGFLNNLISEKLTDSGNCMDLIDGGILIERSYTCYNASSNELDIGIKFGNKKIDSLRIGLNSKGDSNEINIPGNYSYLKKYNENYNTLTELSTGTRTYTINLTNLPNGLNDKPDSIEIYPIIGGSECGKSDSISKISSCGLF